jgi:hypothetical protein
MQRSGILPTTIGLVLILGVTACGGATTPDAGTTVPDATVAADASAPAGEASQSSDPGQPDATSAPEGGGAAGPLNTAVVTIGDERFDFTDVQCSIFTAGYIQAGNFGGDPEVSIVLPPDGWETQTETFSPPSVRVKIGDDVTGQYWLAGDDGTPTLQPVPDGASQIDSYTVPEGRPVTATGTATFIDIVAHNNGQDAPSMSGSFEVSCP